MGRDSRCSQASEVQPLTGSSRKEHGPSSAVTWQSTETGDAGSLNFPCVFSCLGTRVTCHHSCLLGHVTCVFFLLKLGAAMMDLAILFLTDGAAVPYDQCGPYSPVLRTCGLFPTSCAHHSDPQHT